MLVRGTTSRGVAKSKLIERLEGKIIVKKSMPAINTTAAWQSETIPNTIEDINYCLEAILYLPNQEIGVHHQYIRAVLLRIFNNEYEKASSVVASNIRIAICRIDEALYLEN